MHTTKRQTKTTTFLPNASQLSQLQKINNIFVNKCTYTILTVIFNVNPG